MCIIVCNDIYGCEYMYVIYQIIIKYIIYSLEVIYSHICKSKNIRLNVYTMYVLINMCENLQVL